MTVVVLASALLLVLACSSAALGSGEIKWKKDGIPMTRIIVERPMYFNYKAGQPGYSWTGGHDVMGY